MPNAHLISHTALFSCALVNCMHMHRFYTVDDKDDKLTRVALGRVAGSIVSYLVEMIFSKNARCQMPELNAHSCVFCEQILDGMTCK
jgi:hypothetical protein